MGEVETQLLAVTFGTLLICVSLRRKSVSVFGSIILVLLVGFITLVGFGNSAREASEIMRTMDTNISYNVAIRAYRDEIYQYIPVLLSIAVSQFIIFVLPYKAKTGTK